MPNAHRIHLCGHPDQHQGIETSHQVANKSGVPLHGLLSFCRSLERDRYLNIILDYRRPSGELSLLTHDNQDANKALVSLETGETLTELQRTVEGKQLSYNACWRDIWFNYNGIAINKPGRYHFYFQVWYHPPGSPVKRLIKEVSGTPFHCWP